MSLVKASKILLPNKKVNLEKWAVIACDQFTSQKNYWENLKTFVGKEPSTLNLIYPEAYLSEFSKKNIQKIHNNMEAYVQKGVLKSQGRCLILVVRKMKTYTRIGLMVDVDLDKYDYRKENLKSLIRPSEATVIERLPIRAEIKRGALLDIPHIILLMNDYKYDLINSLYKERKNFEKVYDFELNQDGGHIEGYKISDKTKVADILKKLKDINTHTKFLVGDGNHSLAAAKMCWEEKRVTLTPKEIRNYPLRYALIELEDVNDESMVIEPIHRVLFNVDENFEKGLKEICPKGKRVSKLFYADGKKGKLTLPENSVESIAKMQEYIDGYLKSHKEAQIDYIHGEKDLIDVVKSGENAIGIEFPQVDKNELFEYVGKYGPMPRKSFSIGEAVEKRYYLESHKIK